VRLLVPHGVHVRSARDEHGLSSWLFRSQFLQSKHAFWLFCAYLPAPHCVHVSRALPVTMKPSLHGSHVESLSARHSVLLCRAVTSHVLHTAQLAIDTLLLNLPVAHAVHSAGLPLIHTACRSNPGLQSSQTWHTMSWLGLHSSLM
jgi:hypothetical protein